MKSKFYSQVSPWFEPAYLSGLIPATVILNTKTSATSKGLYFPAHIMLIFTSFLWSCCLLWLKCAPQSHTLDKSNSWGMDKTQHCFIAQCIWDKVGGVGIITTLEENVDRSNDFYSLSSQRELMSHYYKHSLNSEIKQWGWWECKLEQPL